MDPDAAGHSRLMLVDSAHSPAAAPIVPGGALERSATLSFEAVHREHFAFVWRSARRLGVADPSLDDVVQEIFMVVHRRLDEFEGRSKLKTWLFGIVLRVVRDYRRTLRRKSPHALRADAAVDPDLLSDRSGKGPHESAANAEAVRLLHALLDDLDDEKREVFVLAELEQLVVPEIAEAIGVNVSTVYSRLRAARQQFEQALARHRAKDNGRPR